MLSSRLSAFVIPTSQKSATTTPRTSFVTSSTRSPAAIAIPAAPNWTASLASGLRWRTSSITPATSRIAAPARIPASSQDASTAPTATASAAPAARPAAMPTPPKVGVDAVVPALAGGDRDEPPGDGRRAKQGPEDEARDGQRGDRDGCAHGS